MTKKTVAFRSFLPETFPFAVFFTCWALTLSGCWEEIRYEPSEASPVANNSDVPSESPDPIEEIPAAIPEQAEAEQEPSPAPVLPESPPVVDNDILPTPPTEAPLEATPAEEAIEVANEIDPADAAAEEEPEAELPVVEQSPVLSARTAWATWQMASQWSIAAAYYSKGVEEKQYGEYLEQARYAASLLEVELPEFSVDVPIQQRQKAIRELLRKEATQELVEQLRDRYGSSSVGLAELAVRSNLLLLTYTPTSSRVAPLLEELRRAAKDSRLPSEVYEELFSLVEERAEFKKVKSAVFKLHRQLVPTELKKLAE